MYSTDLDHKTGLYVCSYRLFLISLTEATDKADTFATTGIEASDHEHFSNSSASRSATPLISTLWKGALTFRRMAFLAPLDFAVSMNLCTAPTRPDTTTCPGALKFAG